MEYVLIKIANNKIEEPVLTVLLIKSMIKMDGTIH